MNDQPPFLRLVFLLYHFTKLSYRHIHAMCDGSKILNITYLRLFLMNNISKIEKFSINHSVKSKNNAVYRNYFAENRSKIALN